MLAISWLWVFLFPVICQDLLHTWFHLPKDSAGFPKNQKFKWSAHGDSKGIGKKVRAAVLEEEFISKEIKRLTEEKKQNLICWGLLSCCDILFHEGNRFLLQKHTKSWLREWMLSVRALLHSGNKQHHKIFVPPALLQWKLCFSVCLLQLNYPRSVCHSMGCTHTTPPCLNSPGILWSLGNVGDICCKHRPVFHSSFFIFLYTGRSGEQNLHLPCCCRGSAPLHHLFKCLHLI